MDKPVRYDLPIPFGWYAVSLSHELEVGQVKPAEYFGREMVLFRTESGEAKVLDAYCPHLGAHLQLRCVEKGEGGPGARAGRLAAIDVDGKRQ